MTIIRYIGVWSKIYSGKKQPKFREHKARLQIAAGLLTGALHAGLQERHNLAAASGQWYTILEATWATTLSELTLAFLN